MGGCQTQRCTYTSDIISGKPHFRRVTYQCCTSNTAPPFLKSLNLLFVVLLGQFGLHLLHVTRAGLSGGGGGQYAFTPLRDRNNQPSGAHLEEEVHMTFKKNSLVDGGVCVRMCVVCVCCGLEFISAVL